MISVCIPVYNYDVRSLAKDLQLQIDGLKVPAELILIDDASEEKYRELQKEIKGQVRRIQLEKNIGRSRIRNLFLQHAYFDRLVFLDCDSEIIRDDFLQKYVDKFKRYEVVYGGRVYPEVPPSFDYRLHWRYGNEIESKSHVERRKHKHRSFMTNNFGITRKVLEKVKFNENIYGYGHEDTLFGYHLGLANIPVAHIDNPVMNGELSTNEDFIAKSEEALRNLMLILNEEELSAEFRQEISLLRFADRLEKWRLKGFARLFLRPFKSIMRKRLLSGKGSLECLALFKWLTFDELIRKSR
jgi:glycosyltransferase involved in cell wall biosynthesis